MSMKTTKISRKSVRLGTDVVPTRYAITLKPDLEAHIFEGEETIDLVLAKSARQITLHSKNLDILSAVVTVGKDNMPAEKITYDEKSETATFVYPRMIEKGKAKLHLVFEGILSDDMRGFYKSKYVVDGQERFMATTQFEATDARKCIPCFDEPAHKAVFDVKLIVPTGKTAISNTLPTSIAEHEAGYKIVSFAPTPKMSTYLLAFIVGDFEWIEQKTKGGVLVRVMTVPGKKQQARFALEVATRGLEWYEQYFGIKYPLNTLDMIALPDFASAAMENWGAITYRETALLVDPENTSIDSKRWVALVVLHELAHQWFGNLVTMEWWTHLWLNEGFAAYMEHLSLDALYPEFDIWAQFVSGAPSHGLGSTLRPDSQQNTHPIEVEVHHPSEIGEIFDAISYSKGATVIRMLAEYLGPKHFRDGLRHYLKKHSYTNASTVDLWNAFEKISGKPVKKMMAVWTTTSGYPLLSVEETAKGLALSQERFFANPKSAVKSKDKTVWPIPLSLLSQKGSKNLGLVSKKKTIIEASNASWLKLNTHETSLFRTQYSNALLEKLATAIKEGKLSAVDRLGVIRDAFALAQSGHISATVPLSLLNAYENEDDYIVWSEILTGLGQISNILYGTDVYPAFRAYAKNIVSPAAARAGWEKRKGETPHETILRDLLLGSAASFGDEDVIQEAKTRFAARKTKPIAADMRAVVYTIVAREGGKEEYEAFLHMYRTEELHEEKERALSALASFKNQTLLGKALMFGLTDEVRLQNKIHDLWRIGLASLSGRETTWNFVKKNWKKIISLYGAGNHILTYLVLSLSRNTTMQMHADIKSFFKTNKVPSAARAIAQTLEYVEMNALWKKRDEKKIGEWLKNKQSHK